MFCDQLCFEIKHAQNVSVLKKPNLMITRVWYIILGYYKIFIINGNSPYKVICNQSFPVPLRTNLFLSK